MFSNCFPVYSAFLDLKTPEALPHIAVRISQRTLCISGHGEVLVAFDFWQDSYDDFDYSCASQNKKKERKRRRSKKVLIVAYLVHILSSLKGLALHLIYPLYTPFVSSSTLN